MDLSGPHGRKQDWTGIPYDLIFCADETVWQSQNLDKLARSARVEPNVLNGRPQGRNSGGGVGESIVVKGQSGRACAEPASRPQPRGAGSERSRELGRRRAHADAAAPTMPPVATCRIWLGSSAHPDGHDQQ